MNIYEKYHKLLEAVKKMHSQHADDRCWMDADAVYEAAGLPPVDKTVGDKEAMRRNCDRFIDRQCEGGGGWKSYAELESENAELKAENAGLQKELDNRNIAAAERHWQREYEPVKDSKRKTYIHPFVSTPRNGPCSSCGKKRSDPIHNYKETK